MAAEVCILVGPARSGKTERLLREYRQALAARGTGGKSALGGCLWIAPSMQGANEIRGRLLGPELAACLEPGCTTFSQLGGWVIDAAGIVVRPVGDTMRRQLLRKLVDDAVAAGMLPYFGAIAHTDGLIDQLEGFIRELKRLEVWPEDFGRAIGKRKQSPKDGELLALYENYQRALLDNSLYDREGQFWEARTQLQKRNDLRPFDRLRTVVVDGFSDFTRTQHEVLQTLAARAGRVWISLPLEDSETREELFSKPRATLAELRKRHHGAQVEHAPRASCGNWPALAHVERSLFCNPRQPLAPPAAERIEIIAATGELGELQQIARRIKRVLVEGDGGGPIRPQQIAVVFRSVGENAALVQEVFAAYGIPHALEWRAKLSTAPAVRALLAVLRLAAGDWPYGELLGVLNHNYFRPRWAEWKNGAALAACERTLRHLQIAAGRTTLLTEAERLATVPPQTVPPQTVPPQTVPPVPPPAERDAEDHIPTQRRQRAAAALPLLQRLSATLEALPKQATCREWADVLERLAVELGILAQPLRQSAGTYDERSSPDAIAIAALLAAIRSADQLNAWLVSGETKIARGNLPTWLRQLADDESLPTSHDAAGRVRVLPADTARTVSVDYLFVAGLSEKAFPRGDRGGVYSEAEQRRLIEAGLALPTRREKSYDELLLFYEVVTRARRRLYLSFAALDDKAQPLSPSSYLLEIERLFGGELRRREIPDLSPVPLDDALCSPTEQRVKGVAAALSTGGERVLAGWRRNDPAGSAAAWRGLQLVAERTGKEFGPFDGMLPGQAARDWLADKYGPGRLWSASQLEQYVGCPHKFFLARVLGIEPWDEADLATDYGARGSLLHNALAELHRRCNQQRGGPASPAGGDLDEFQQAMADVLAMYLAKRQRGPLAAALGEVDRRLLLRWGANYLAQHQQYDAGFREVSGGLAPAHFEVSFGEEECAPDALSSSQPFILRDGDDEVRLRGRIDRIDIGRVGEQVVFNVLDYKSGKHTSSALKREQIDAGLILQLPLYTLAAQHVLLAEQKAVPLRAGYWHVRDKGFDVKNGLALTELGDSGLGSSEAVEAMHEQVTRQVFALVRGIRDGQFPMFSQDDECTGRCEFRTVCRVGQARSLEKQWEPPRK